MLDWDTASVFFGASVLLGMAPGPDNIFVLTSSSAAGVRAGLLVTLGLCTGLVFHTAIVALGLAALLQTAPLALTVLKFLGAAYLVYLAWQTFRADPIEVSRGISGRSARMWYVRGIVLNVTNPKVALFFLAFLPQFVSSAETATLQIAQLGTLFILATIIVFGTIASLAGALGRQLSRSNAAQTWLNRAAGTVFVLLAAHLLVADR